jgi:2-oxoglutarate dehydrogenase E2 component (dihydrolipoamide succinyltransferase)
MTIQRVRVPEIGESVSEGTITAWLVNIGDLVAAGQPLFELSTDKIDSEIPSPIAGRLFEITAASGAHVKVGDDVAAIDLGEVPTSAESTSHTMGPDSAPLASGDLNTSETIAQGLSRDSTRSKRWTAPLPPSPESRPLRWNQEPDPADSAGAVSARDSFEPFTRVRARTAEVMAASSSTIPHVLSMVEVDYLHIRQTRQSWSAAPRPTPLAFAVVAVVRALGRFPRLNASVVSGGLELHAAINIAIAVETDVGLMAPVIKGADALSVDGVASAILRLSEAARAGRLTPDDLAGATFTITNNGSAGSLLTTPLVTPPQVAALSTDRITDRPTVIDFAGEQGLAIRPMGNLALCWDHRAIGGAEAARFLVEVKTSLEGADWIGHA